MIVKTFPASKGTFSEAGLERVWLIGQRPVIVNDVYLQNFNRKERIQIWYGGSGGGKSDAKATELLLKCLFQPYCRVMFCRKTAESIRNSQFQLFKDLIKRYGFTTIFKVNEQSMAIVCTENGNMLFGKGLDDVDKVKSIPDITDIWLEEPIDKRGTIQSTDFTELNRRLRCPKASNHIHLTFNPISSESWIHEYFFKSNEYEAFKLCTTYKDNYFASDETERQFEILRTKKLEEYKVYALGEWGKLKQGLVFPEYTIIQDFPQDCSKWGYGLDWGFYPDPTALIKSGIKHGALILDEVIYENNHTSGSRAETMKARGVSVSTKIIADPNPEAIAEMKTKGYYNITPAKKGPGSVKAGIDHMKEFKIMLTARSHNLKKEFDNYAWQINKHSEEPTGEPIDDFNHGIDASRYWTMANAVQRQGVRFA